MASRPLVIKTPVLPIKQSERESIQPEIAIQCSHYFRQGSLVLPEFSVAEHRRPLPPASKAALPTIAARLVKEIVDVCAHTAFFAVSA